jgi:hypothetical protein
MKRTRTRISEQLLAAVAIVVRLSAHACSSESGSSPTGGEPGRAAGAGEDGHKPPGRSPQDPPPRWKLR